MQLIPRYVQGHRYTHFRLQHKFLAVELLDQRLLNFKSNFGKQYCPISPRRGCASLHPCQQLYGIRWLFRPLCVCNRQIVSVCFTLGPAGDIFTADISKAGLPPLPPRSPEPARRSFLPSLSPISHPSFLLLCSRCVSAPVQSSVPTPTAVVSQGCLQYPTRVLASHGNGRTLPGPSTSFPFGVPPRHPLHEKRRPPGSAYRPA